MKLIVLFFILFISISSIEASYLRSIRIGTYPSEERAKKALLKLNEYIAAHKDIVKLQKEWGFIFKQRKSGKYYITLAEPFTNRKVLQKVLNTLRLAYPDVYVTRLKRKSPSKEIKNTEKKLQEIEQKVQTTNEAKEKPSILQVQEDLQLETTQDKEKSLHESVIEHELNNTKTLKVEKSKTFITTSSVEKTSAPQKTRPQIIVEKESSIYIIAFYIVVVLLMIFSFILFYYRKKFLEIKEKEFIVGERFKQLKEEIENKEQLISYVSHEIRTPMTAIMGMVNLVLESDLTPPQKDYLEKIEKSSTYLLNLLNDILDLSKIEADKLAIDKSEFNINDVLYYVYNVISINAQRNNIHISMHIDKDVPSHVMGDSLRVGQVLINLLGNAVKFTKDGEVSLSVSKKESFADKAILEFRVTDTGIGMTQEQIENLFNSYYQADASISREYGGTGLGLAISKHLIGMMGGEIRVESQKGIGTTFMFHLPFSLKDAENKRQYRLPSKKLLYKKVLLVDSSNKTAIPLMQALGYFHYIPYNIPSFEKIIDKLDANEYDIIIINIENLTSKAIENIKNMKKIHNLKVVIVSDLHSSLEDGSFSNLMIDSYIKPPITIQSVLDMVTELYTKREKPKALKKVDNYREELKKFKEKKILVVDDNELNHKVIAGILAKIGIEVTFVDNGQKAIDLLHKGVRIDLILMDINMPIKNGYDTSLEIRQDRAYNNIPIIAFSADLSSEAIKKSFKSGMQGHLSKPINMDEFYSKIIELFKNKNFTVATMKQKKSHLALHKDNKMFLSQKGLIQCSNDRGVYKIILNDFLKMYKNVVHEFYDLCISDKFKEARYLAMDFKDVAFNIGAYKLAEGIAALEYEIEKGCRGNWRGNLKEMEDILNQLFKEIQKYLQEI